MAFHMGGQTLLNRTTKKPVIYVDNYRLKSKEDDSRFITMYQVFDGKELIEVESYEIDFIFETPVADLERRIYYGKYCTGKMDTEINFDECDPVEAKRYLSSVKGNITKGNLHLKNYA